MKRRNFELEDMVIVDDEDVERDKKRAKLEVAQGLVRWTTPTEHHAIAYEASYEPETVSEVSILGYPQEATPIKAKDYYYQFIHRTAEQCLEEGSAPQRSEAWKRARQFAITGSDFGSAVGHNPHCTPTELLKKKLWETFQGNSATRWGSANEPRAAEAFLAYTHANVSPNAVLIEKGLLKFTDMPWIGVSPDGFLLYEQDGVLTLDLVEYKCPTRYETDDHPYAKYTNNTPPYYRDQMLGIWGYLNSHGGVALSAEDNTITNQALKLKLGKAWFVVWQPKTLWVVQHSFEPSEWETLLLDLRKWYFGKFLPCLVWLYEGKLSRGNVEPDRDAIEVDDA